MIQQACILLVDDEASIQSTVGLLLRSCGYHVDIAATGAEALEIFGERPPDLVVLEARALSRLGRTEEARAAATEARKLRPGAFDERVVSPLLRR